MSRATALGATLLFVAQSLLGAQSETGASEPRIIDASNESPETNPVLSALVTDVRQQADAFVFLSGGASAMSLEQQDALVRTLGGLRLLAESGRRFAVGDGGTRAGIMESAGRVRRETTPAFPLIGVAPAAQIPPTGKTPIDPNHSHLVSVRDPSGSTKGAWGSETNTMYWLFAKLAEGRPSVTIVANGGSVVLKEIDANIRAGRQMILLKGSGRAVDAVVSLLEDVIPSDAEVLKLRKAVAASNLTRSPELFRIVPLQAGAEGLRDALIAALAP